MAIILIFMDSPQDDEFRRRNRMLIKQEEAEELEELEIEETEEDE